MNDNNTFISYLNDNSSTVTSDQERSQKKTKISEILQHFMNSTQNGENQPKNRKTLNKKISR